MAVGSTPSQAKGVLGWVVSEAEVVTHSSESLWERLGAREGAAPHVGAAV